ncbi:MAG: hypothetical protein ABI467_04750 [Kofleriaceae bacterium]
MGRLLWLAAALATTGLIGCGNVASPVLLDAFHDPLDSVTVTGKSALPWSLSTKLIATANFHSGHTIDVSNVATWSSESAATATVDADGNVEAVDAGMTMVHANYEGQDGVLELTVTMPTVAVSSFNNKGIDFFPANATGNIAPLRSIRGAMMTTLGSPRGLALNGNELFVADQGNAAIDVFPADGSGDIAPLRQIKGALTTLNTPSHVAVTDTDIYVADFSNKVAVFPKTATGNVAPSRTISITGLTQNNGIAVSQDTLFVLDISGNAIDAVPLTSNGVTTPRTIVGAATLISEPNGGFYANDELFVSNATGTIIVFDPTATGNVPPIRRIGGAMSMLGFPDGMGLLGTHLYSANNSTSSIQVHLLSSSGDVAPTNSISGAMTLMSGSLGLVIIGLD